MLRSHVLVAFAGLAALLCASRLQAHELNAPQDAAQSMEQAREDLQRGRLDRAELLLEHTHEGVDLDVQYTNETLRNVAAIWTRPVHLITRVESRKVLYTCDGKGSLTEKTIG